MQPLPVPDLVGGVGGSVLVGQAFFVEAYVVAEANHATEATVKSH
jgi:hypothetical protein